MNEYSYKLTGRTTYTFFATKDAWDRFDRSQIYTLFGELDLARYEFPWPITVQAVDTDTDQLNLDASAKLQTSWDFDSRNPYPDGDPEEPFAIF